MTRKRAVCRSHWRLWKFFTCLLAKKNTHKVHWDVFLKPFFCEGNPPVTGEFPLQRTVARSFEVFFDLRLNKRLSKQSRRRWFETSSRSLWRHCNEWLLGDMRHSTWRRPKREGNVHGCRVLLVPCYKQWRDEWITWNVFRDCSNFCWDTEGLGVGVGLITPFW